MRVLAMAVVFVVLAVAGCSTTPGSAGDTSVTSQVRPVPAFDSVDLTGIGTVNIRQTGTDSVTVTATTSILPHVTTDVSGTTLRLGLKDVPMTTDTTLTFDVTVRSLAGVSLSGAGDINAADIESPRLTADIGGAGRFTPTGRATDLDLTLGGAGSFDGSRLSTENATVRLTGTGNATVAVSGSLRADVSGIGSVEYIGDPDVTRNVTGLGSVQKKG
ncbi:GIN domain-containing protein [Pseudonocardia bannensis]|uniref:DUF2807 domain-containing protein n=1 Tax=Pseudonocardia bannensis TaxID=630973 RepID=A0A848DT89_9PSEU|nr:DUF2807 domain-containing protein [Pseudonocardia bannensis]NMH95699.1 DUF2807 domain-containing protein [Pseudonocardia bannensis]